MHTVRPDHPVQGLQEIDPSEIALVGGKGAHLAALSRLDGIRVPEGFCVTTTAYLRVLAAAPSVDERLDRLSGLRPDDHEAIRARSAEIRAVIEGLAIPEDLAAAITASVDRLGDRAACAVRSSATAEDLPTASFAGQQDSFLNVVGPTAIVEHVRRCWASLFTDRAVTYRLRNGVDHRAVQMAVVVQRMVVPHAAGVLFTADPVTGDRRVASVEATTGLGEALVAGLVDPDGYRVRDDEIVERTIAAKRIAVRATPGGGTHEHAVEPGRQEQPALTDAQVVELVRLGRRIEAHLGAPQDIEWCLADDGFHVVQSRPITTLFPIPEADDDDRHVYVSVGHQQMMTDAMKALGLSMWRLTAGRPMDVAGGRLFVDVTDLLASPSSRSAVVEGFRRSDPLLGDALQTLVDRGAIPSRPDGPASALPPMVGGPATPVDPDPAMVTTLIEENRTSVAALERAVAATSGAARLDLIVDDLQEMKRVLHDPRNLPVIMAGMDALWWLNQHLEEWLGERNAGDTFTQSVPHNVTSAMGLALLDVADAVRPHPQVVAFLAGVEDDDRDFLDELPALEGGREVRDAIAAFLDEYGARCVGEIDITRPRWSERPGALVPAILGNVRAFAPGEAERRFEQGRREAEGKERDVLARLRSLPDGEEKARETKRMIDRVRAFAGYREYPKYGMVRRYAVYKRALLEEAERLVRAQVLDRAEDIFHLTFEELHDAVHTQRVDRDLIRRRQEEFRSFQALVPPRVLTSDGEAVTGAYRRDDLPAGALAGLPVSAGAVEGRARVILDMADADLDPGDILVTTATDPSWSPLFVAIGGLVTEVGGLMTHGAVIAREYGRPAVVGVEGATRRIEDGQRIRVDGTHGFVVLLVPVGTPGG
jgi:pyruvate,water dikinase